MKNQPSKRASLDWTARTQASVSVCMVPGWGTGQGPGWPKSDMGIGGPEPSESRSPRGPGAQPRIARTSSNSTYACASKSTNRTSSTGATVSASTVRTAIRAPSSIGQP